MSSDLQDLPAQAAAPPRRTIAIVWSDADSHTLALALERLVAATFPAHVAPWLSTRDLGPREWRSDLQRVMQDTVATIVAVGPASLDRGARSTGWPRVLYQAGACYRDGATYVIGCGVERSALADTPLEAMRVWDAHDQAHVKAVLGAVATAVGVTPADIERPFDEAWTAYADETARLEGSTRTRAAATAAREEQLRLQAEEARKWARIRSIARAAAIGAALLAVSIAPWAWALWPTPDPPAPCSVGTAAQRAQCQWDQVLETAAARGGTPAPQFAARVGARPFAIVALTPTCAPQAIAHDVRLVTQGAAGDGWTIPMLQATPAPVTSAGMRAALAVAAAGPGVPAPRVEVLESGACAPLAAGAMVVRHIGTLGDAPLCATLDAVRRAFGGTPGAADQVAAFLASSGLGPPSDLEPRITQWLSSCALR